MIIFQQSLLAGGGSGPPGTKPKLSDTDLMIVFDGDSLLETSNNVKNDYVPNKVRDWLLPRCKSLEYYTFAVSGQTTQQMLADIGTQILPLVNPAKTNLIFGWADVNSILNDAITAQQNYNDFANYFSQCKGAGYNYSILATGYYPRTPYNKTDWETGSPSPLDRQHNYFELVAANKPSVVDVVNDFRLLTNMGGARDQAQNPTYFYDSVHHVNPGGDEIADYIINSGILAIFDL